MDNLDTSQLTPEMIEAILSLNSQQTQRQQNNRQLQMAQQMRRQGQEGMGATSPGGGRVGAPNWAGALANVYAAKKASDMEAGANAQTGELDTKRQDALRQYFEAMRSQQRNAQRAGQPSAQPSSAGFVDESFL